MRRTTTGPTPRWFLRQALAGRGPRLALVDALLATVIAIIASVAWRVTSGPRGRFEEIVPMLGLGLRWSVALPIAWSALGAIEDDRKSGRLALARRRGVRLERWLIARALAAGAVVTVAVAGPMILVALVMSTLGGGGEGALARASLVFPSIVIGAASGAIFGCGGVLLGAMLPRRLTVVGAVIGCAFAGELIPVVVPGAVGHALRAFVSPMLALDDLAAALFAVPGTAGAAVLAVVASSVLLLVLARAACASLAELDGFAPRSAT